MSTGEFLLFSQIQSFTFSELRFSFTFSTENSKSQKNYTDLWPRRNPYFWKFFIQRFNENRSKMKASLLVGLRFFDPLQDEGLWEGNRISLTRWQNEKRTVSHVQRFPWATPFSLKVFGFSNYTDFRRCNKPQDLCFKARTWDVRLKPNLYFVTTKFHYKLISLAVTQTSSMTKARTQGSKWSAKEVKTKGKI